MLYTREQIESTVKAKGYKWFEDTSNKSYDVNIVGVRNNSPNIADKVTNLFDDNITISFKDPTGTWQFYCWDATTDPGKKSMLEWNKMGIKGGCARLIPGQYRTTWAIDKHQGKYDALCQRLANVKVFRDANFDLTYDETKITEGMYGINIHKAGKDSTWVENWSAGCQVFKRVKDFDSFLSICKKAAKIHGNKFSYTLLESTDIN
jgi:hypothetical protein